jgi:hypothetical protein
MTRRPEELFPRDLQRALHGGRATRAASDPLRPPEEWELVVAALELALLGRTRDEPPARLAATLTRFLDTHHKPSR